MKKTLLSITLIMAVFLSAYAQSDNLPLFKAAKTNDVAKLTELIKAGADVNSKSEYGATALTFAVEKNSLEAIKVLLEHGADPNNRDRFYQSTPFEWAFYEGQEEIIKLMIQHGADLSTNWLLPFSVRADNIEIVKLLLDKKVSGANEAIGFAVHNKNAEMVKLLLDKRDIKNDHLNAAFVTATGMNNTEIMNLLKDAGAVMPKVNKPDKKLDFVGLYSDKDGQLRIKTEESKLFASFDDVKYYELKYDSGNLFSVAEYPNITLSFKTVENIAVSVQFHNGDNKRDFVRTEEVAKKETKPEYKDEAGEVKEILNWTAFRGVNCQGNGDGQYPPVRWDGEKGLNLQWKTRIPGLSHACPVVWEDKIYVITAIGEDPSAEYRVGLYGDVKPVNDNSNHVWKIYCLDKSKGDIVWEKTAYKGVPKVKRHPKGTQANSSPVTNGKYIAALYGSEGLVCYDMEGNEVWRREMGILDAGWFFESETQWGHAASPIIFKNTVIIQADRSKASYVAAYDLETGKEVWRTEREEISSWGTPVVYYGKDHNELITNGTKHIKAYNPETGEELWKLGPNSEVTVGTPVVYKDLIYVTGGYPPVRPVYAIKPGGRGDISIPDSLSSGEFIKWRYLKGGTYMPSPIAYKGYLYTMANNGLLTCYHAETGEKIYRKNLRSGAVTASLVAADGKLYCTSESKGVIVVKAGPEFEIIARNPIGETCMATPAISDKLFIVRAQDYIYGFGRN
jgi:ankyrin repeat protein/outer membrane protein assembly factor BamB